jgi:hypothetical protein
MTIHILTSKTSSRALHNKKMAPPKLRHGIGANCSILIKWLHPAKMVANKFTNPEHGRHLSDLICLHKERKRQWSKVGK